MAIQDLEQVETLNALSQVSFERDYVEANLPQDDFLVRGFTLNFSTASNLPADDLKACLELVRTTSSAAYRQSARGWSTRSKRSEMRDKDMKYLLIRRGRSDDVLDDQSPVCGFLSFMITIEDDIKVVWCYEIHLDTDIRNQGFGTVLLGILEDITKAVKFKYMMLTVFKSNQRAISFYSNNGWKVHDEETPPSPKRLRKALSEEPKTSICTMLKVIQN